MSENDAPQSGRARPGLNRRGFLGMGAAAGTGAVLAGLLPGRAGAEPSAAAGRTAAGATAAGKNAARGASWTKQASYRMTAQALGVNTTSGDGNFADPVVPGLLKDAHIGRIRYPGGGNADYVNWLSPTNTLPWPTFMHLLAEIGAAPMITVNYGQLAQGPDSAAAWVGSALTFPNYDPSTAVWVLGNEGYGPWELDQHPDPHTPASYAANVAPYFEAMHRVDPHTRVGFPMTIAREVAGGTGTWVGDPDLWNRTVLGRNAGQVDFIDFHWYPIFGIPVLSNAELFATVDRIPGAMSYLQTIIAQYDPNTPVVVSESNISQSEIVYNVQPVSALYAVATALTWLSQGAESYMWWQVHNYDNMNGDFGFLSNGSGTPGPTATTLSASAAVGALSLDVADASGLHYAHQFTIDTGDDQESRKITAVPGSTTLAAVAGPGDSNIKVTGTSTLTTAGATTDYRQFFARGTRITIGTESHTVASVGTAAVTGNLAAPAMPGDKEIRIVGVGMGGQSIPVFMAPGFAVGAPVTIGTGAHAETAKIVAVGTSSSLGTTLAAPAHRGDTTLHVVAVSDTNTGIANYVGDPITIDTGSAEEVATITSVGSSAAAPTSTVLPVAAGDRTVYLASTAGATVGHPLLIGTGSDRQIVSAIASVGAQTATTLAAPAAAGATAINLTSTTGLVAGHPLTLDTGANRETLLIQSVGSAGPTGHVTTLSGPLTAAHGAGTSVVDVGTGVILSHPVTAAYPAGTAAVDLGSGIGISAPLGKAHDLGAPTRDAGSGLVLDRRLRRRHRDGAAVSTPGTGITLAEPLRSRQSVGATVYSTGITVTPALTLGHAAGTSINELGLQEPPLDTPLPAYWGFVLASLMTTPGAEVSEISPSSPATVRAYASHLDGTESICVLNTDDTAAVTVRITGFQHGATIATHSYGLETPSLVTGSTTGRTVSAGIAIPPESVVVLLGSAGAAAAAVSVG